jgi:nitroimidazol reductase NimA-like FMN-containing flavoprotein (pyridoxamine 5'-phosphate oxidase superfamily)
VGLTGVGSNFLTSPPSVTDTRMQGAPVGPAILGGPPMNQPPSSQAESLQVLSLQECLTYLHSANLGRLAFQVDREIDVLPVSYATDGAVVVFRTGLLTRLQRSPRVQVTFEVDFWDPVTGVGWSVVLKGVAREVTSGEDPYSNALRQCKVKPLAPGKREHWIAIYPSEITGRRFHAPAEAS